MYECAWKWDPGESIEKEETEKMVWCSTFMVSFLAIMAGVEDWSVGGTLPCIETSPHLAADAASLNSSPRWNEPSLPVQFVLKPWKSCPLFSVYFFPQRSGMILIQHLEELIPVYQVCIHRLTVPPLPKGFHETPFQNHCLKWSCFKPL